MVETSLPIRKPAAYIGVHHGTEFPQSQPQLRCGAALRLFWGYDNAREVAFQVPDNIHLRLSHEVASEEAAFLATFDRHRERILLLAKAIYTPGARNTYTIS